MRDLDFGIGVLHLDVLRARMGRRRGRWLVALLLLLLVGGLWLGRAPLLAHTLGYGRLVVRAPVDVQVTVAQQPWQPGTALLPGHYALTATRAGFYPYTTMVQITRAQTTTVTVPPLRPRPSVHAVPLPAEGMQWARVSSDPAGGWRLTAQRLVAASPNRPRATPSIEAESTLVVRGDTLLPGVASTQVADELRTDTARWFAGISTPDTRTRRAAAVLTVQTPTATLSITPTVTLTGLWWGPGGQTLLLSGQGLASPPALFVWHAGQTSLGTPLITLPAAPAAVFWHPDGRAAVVLSQVVAGGPEATLLAGLARGQAQAQRLPPSGGSATVPLLAWDTDTLWWGAQDRTLLRVPLDGRLPRRAGTLATQTLALRAADGQIWTLEATADATIVLRDWQQGAVLAVVDDVALSTRARGLWDGTTLLIQENGTTLWLLTFADAVFAAA